ncbi:secretion protein [Brevibacillus composti]|uniref:Secretion protein n=1 Tax=Brevibacillus composti TaxID=2796470 RepID=A0A7T5ELQ5_9BACL|nr:CAP-associated domain-containing protein [Brevibacillus composti]QQE74899.1 secretion protein [Brevibacillus composti]QUO41983.1 secretion protein [Brevibacillus composti]
MKKWLWIGVFALSAAGIGKLYPADGSSMILASIQPVKLYWDGKEVTAPDKPGYYPTQSGDQPATLSYKGNMYIPLTLAGRLENKPVKQDHTAAFVGQAPVGGDDQAAGARSGSGKADGEPPQMHAADGAQSGQPATRRSDAAAPADSSAKQPAPSSPATAARTAAARESVKTAAETTLFGIALGMTEADVIESLGRPDREEPSGLGYQWLIYNRNPARYLQVGIMDGKVVDLYSNAAEVKLGQVGIGTSLSALGRQYKLQPTLSFSYQRAQVQITNQPSLRPLVIEDGIPRIFYLDKQNRDKVTGIRLIDTLILMRGGYYETRWTYQGEAPHFDPPPLTIKQQEAVNAAREKQVLDLVNVIRYRYNLPKVQWSEQAAQVARGHSQDMKNHDYFDHVSATTGMDPFERLRKAGLSYSMAGENIAAGYPDSIEAHESWMNSLGHRKNVLEKGFTHLGVGVKADYYTQAFLTPKP